MRFEVGGVGVGVQHGRVKEQIRWWFYICISCFDVGGSSVCSVCTVWQPRGGTHVEGGEEGCCRW
jgi:hypothetical protein